MTAPDPNRGNHHDNQQQLDELLAGYVLGDLDEGERQRLRELLVTQPELQGQLDELRLTLELMPLALPDAVPPPPRLRQRLLRSEQHYLQRPAPLDRPRWPAIAQLSLAGMAITLVLLGTQLVQLRVEMTKLRQVQPSTASRILTLQGTSGHAGITGAVLVNPGQDHNLLRVRGLPPAPPSHVYRLWVNVNGSTKGCVQFLPDIEGRVTIPIPTLPSSKAQSASVTLERLKPDGRTPTGPWILTSA